MNDIQLYHEIQHLTSDQKQKVKDFIVILKSKSANEQPLKERQFGIAKGLFVIKEDFDTPLDDFKEYM